MGVLASHLAPPLTRCVPVCAARVALQAESEDPLSRSPLFHGRFWNYFSYQYNFCWVLPWVVMPGFTAQIFLRGGWRTMKNDTCF